MAILINILYLETAVSVVCRRIELVLYCMKHDLYAWTDKTIRSGEMEIIKANCLCRDCEIRQIIF